MRALLCCVVLFSLWATGCASSPKCLFSVGNKGEVSLQDVALEQDGNILYSASTVPPRNAGEYRPLGKVFPRVSRLRWKVDGRDYATDISLERPVAPSFDGRVQFEVNASNQVRAFVIPADANATGDIPWSSTGTFDGNVMFPGFNQ